MRQVKIGKVLLTYGGEWTASKGYPVLTYVLHDGDGWWNVTPCVNSEPKDNNPVWVRATNVSALRTAVQTLITNGQQLEAAMEAAEAIRVSAESARVSAESARVSAENARVSAENARVSAENVRVSAENGRNNAESGRVNAETLRVSAENARVSAETARETASAQAVTNANTATAAANSAASGANTAAGNANTAATGAGNVNATISGTTLTVTDRTGSSTSVDTKGEKGDKGDKGDTGGTFADAPSDSKVYGRKNGTWVESVDESLASRVSSLESSKADKNGHYEGMSVAMAENLIGKGNATEQTFTERVAGGGASIEDGVAEYRKIKGNSVAWRQMLSFGNTTAINGITYTPLSNGYIHIEGTSTGRSNVGYLQFDIVPSHKYILANIGLDNNDSQHMSFLFYNDSSFVTYFLVKSQTKVFTSRDDANRGTVEIVAAETQGITVDKDVALFLLDLTLTFESAVAETITTADDVAKLLGYDSWSAYASSDQFATDMQYSEVGEIRNFTAKKVVTTGRNLWDEDWEYGVITSSDGSNADVELDDFRSKNFIKISPSTKYYVKSSVAIYIKAYDENKVPIGTTWTYPNVTNNTFTTSEIAHYLRFRTEGNNGATYNHDIFIYNVQGMTDSQIASLTYEPYEKHELNVDPSTIKDADGNQLFPHGLCSAGSVRDEITKDGAVKRVGCVKLKDLSWIKWGESYQSSLRLMEQFTLDILCSRYAVLAGTYPSERLYRGQVDKMICGSDGFSGGYNVILRDSSYTDAELFKASLTDSDLLFYELATPISVTFADERQTDVEVFANGTEKIVVAEGGKSTPIVADVNYSIDYVTTIDKLHEAMPNVQEVKSEVDASVQAWQILIAEKWGISPSNVVVVDMGDLQYTDGGGVFYSYSIPNLKNMFKGLCLKYTIVESKYTEMEDKTISSFWAYLSSSSTLIIKDSQYGNDPSALKNSLKGIYLFYEKA